MLTSRFIPGLLLVLAAGCASPAPSPSEPHSPPGAMSPVGVYRHSVNHRVTGIVELRPDGGIGPAEGPARWTATGDALTLRWPRGDAPGGVWVDHVRLAPDGRRYEGTNQLGDAITGERLDRAQPAELLTSTTPHWPLAFLPRHLRAPAGAVSLLADYDDVRRDRIVLFLVNRTGRDLLVPTQDGDPFVKLEGRAGDGRWERAQGHVYSDCGNSYMVTPRLPDGRLFAFYGYHPASGEARPIRYRIFGLLDLVSNEGTGWVDPAAIRAARRDAMAARYGDFATVVALAVEKTPVPPDTWPDVRLSAVTSLRRFRTPGSVRTLGSLLGDGDAQIRRAAAQSLAAIGPPALTVRHRLELLRDHDPDPAVRSQAEATLRHLTR